MKYLLVLLLITSFFCNTNCRTVSTKTEADNYKQLSHRSPELEIKNDTFPPKKIYARYGDIILDRNGGNGAYRFQSNDERLIIDQPWDGLLIYRDKHNGDFMLDYYDKNHVLVKQIDLKKINPYNKEKYKLLSDTIGFNSGFESVYRNVMDDTLYDYKKHATEYRTQIYTNTQISNYVNIADNKNKRVAVCFDLIPMTDDLVIGWESSIFVFDSLGNLTDKIENLNYDVNYPQITTDGRYLTFTYGHTMDDDFHYLRKFEGAIIYDIKNKHIVYKEESKIRGGNGIYGFSEAKKDVILLVKKLQPNKVDEHKPYKCLMFFDMKNRIKYFTEIKLNEISPRNKVFDKSKGRDQYLEMYDYETTKF